MLSLIICTLVALFFTSSQSFIHPSTRHQYHSSSTSIHHPSLLYHDNTILCSQNKSENEEDNSDDDNIDNDDEDNTLLNELRQQAQAKLGADIPNTDEFKEAAKAAEDDFLSAMLEQSNKFKEIKSNEGADKACEVFMDEIQKSESNIENNNIQSHAPSKHRTNKRVFSALDNNDDWQ